jgi:TonB family protein
MRIRIAGFMLLLVLPCSLIAMPQQELGKWWKNSEIVKQLQLSEDQISQIEQRFLNHRRELMGFNAELKSHEQKLKMLMQSEPPDDAQVLAQTELIATTRAALEKAYASMMLSIRKELTKEQWQKLEEVRELRNVSIIGGMHPEPGLPGEDVYSVRGAKPPKVIYQPMPSYTEEARQKRIEGLILMQVFVRKDGTVGDAKVLKGLGCGLDESAISTITKEWRFEPGTVNGQPVEIQATVEISFRLY